MQQWHAYTNSGQTAKADLIPSMLRRLLTD